MSELPPSLPGVVSGVVQQNFDALNRRLWEAEKELAELQASVGNNGLIVGSVKATGERESGTRFASEKVTTGLYRITLSTELASAGVCVPSTVGAIQFARTQTHGQKVFEVATEKTSTLVLEDAAFDFFVKAT